MGVLFTNAAWNIVPTELPAPQATLMKMVVEGVMGNSLPWSLVFAGVAIAIVVEILQIPVLPICSRTLPSNLFKYTYYGWWTCKTLL